MLVPRMETAWCSDEGGHLPSQSELQAATGCCVLPSPEIGLLHGVGATNTPAELSRDSEWMCQGSTGSEELHALSFLRPVAFPSAQTRKTARSLCKQKLLVSYIGRTSPLLTLHSYRKV